MQPIAVFERRAADKAAGCLMYALAVPTACVALTLFVWIPVGLAAQGLGAPESVLVFSLPVIFLAVSAGVVRFGWREFRRRAGIRIAIFPDRIEEITEHGRTSTPFSNVQGIVAVAHGRDMECVLRLRDGSTHQLNPQFAPYSAVEAVLRPTLVARLVAAADEALKSGGTVPVYEASGSALPRILRGRLRQLVGIALMLTVRGLAAGLEQFAAGRLMVLRGRMARGGGFAISAEGVIYSLDGFESTAAWDEIRVVQNDHVGIVLETSRGDRVSASPYAAQFVLASALIEEKVSSGSDKALARLD